MIRPMVVLWAAFVATACADAKTHAPETGRASTISASSRATPASATPGEVPRPWDDAIGPVIATPAPDGGEPVVFVRDTGRAGELDVELLDHSENRTRASLHPGPATRACAWRRGASVMNDDGRGIPGGWSLAMARGIAVPFRIEDASDLSPRDSATLVASISRLASAIPDDSASIPFHGLPVVVRDVWRFRLTDSTMVIVAVTTRSLNLESNPRSEARTLIAEADPSKGEVAWRTGFSEHVAGPEDRVERMDLLAAFRVRGSKPAVALVRGGDDGLQLEIVERDAAAAWRLHWSSLSLPCAHS